MDGTLLLALHRRCDVYVIEATTPSVLAKNLGMCGDAWHLGACARQNFVTCVQIFVLLRASAHTSLIVGIA